MTFLGERRSEQPDGFSGTKIESNASKRGVQVLVKEIDLGDLPEYSWDVVHFKGVPDPKSYSQAKQEYEKCARVLAETFWERSKRQRAAEAASAKRGRK